MHLISFYSNFIIVLSTFILAVIKVYLPKFFFFFVEQAWTLKY